MNEWDLLLDSVRVQLIQEVNLKLRLIISLNINENKYGIFWILMELI